MKKLLFTGIAFIAFSSISFSNTITEKIAKDELKISSSKIEKIAETICCTRRGKSSNGQSVAITACVESTGDLAIDTGRACEKAAAIVKANITLLDGWGN